MAQRGRLLLRHTSRLLLLKHLKAFLALRLACFEEQVGVGRAAEVAWVLLLHGLVASEVRGGGRPQYLVEMPRVAVRGLHRPAALCPSVYIASLLHLMHLFSQ